jgi:hypothetical protein
MLSPPHALDFVDQGGDEGPDRREREEPPRVFIMCRVTEGERQFLVDCERAEPVRLTRT